MRIESLQVISHRSWKVDEVSGPVARERLRRLELYGELRAVGAPEALYLKIIGWPPPFIPEAPPIAVPRRCNGSPQSAYCSDILVILPAVFHQ